MIVKQQYKDDKERKDIINSLNDGGCKLIEDQICFDGKYLVFDIDIMSLMQKVKSLETKVDTLSIAK